MNIQPRQACGISAIRGLKRIVKQTIRGKAMKSRYVSLATNSVGLGSSGAYEGQRYQASVMNPQVLIS